MSQKQKCDPDPSSSYSIDVGAEIVLDGLKVSL